MTCPRSIRFLLLFLSALGCMHLALFVFSGPAVGQSVQTNEVRSALEQSPFADEEKQRVLATVDRAAAVGVPADDMAIIINRGIERGIGAEQLAFFVESAAVLREKGLPVRLVLDRIEQGLAKGVPGERISLSVRKLSGNVEQARPLVAGVKGGDAGGAESERTIETVARALEKSVSGEDIARTAEKVQNREHPMAFFNRVVDTMTIFAGNGMVAADASRLVQQAMDRGYSERDFEIMERYMVEELRKKSSMSQIVSGMEARMDRRSMRGNPDRAGGMRGPGQGGMGGGFMGGRR